MSPLLQVTLAGAGTFLIRISAIAFIGDREFSKTIEKTLRLIAPAVLSALAANSLILDSGELRGLSSWHAAAAIAALVALKTKSLGWTLAAGLAALWAIQAIF